MFTELGVHLNESLVVDAIVGRGEFLTDNAGVNTRHEVLQKRHRCVREEVTTIFGRIGNDAVHFVELLTCDGIGDKRSFVEGLVVSGFRLDAGLHHGFEGKFNSGTHEGDHEDSLVEVFLLSDVSFTFGLFEFSLAGVLAPSKEIDVVVGPVGHHGAGELTGDDVVHMLVEKITHNELELLGEFECFDFRRVGKTVHHVGNTTVLESLGDHFPSMLDEFDSPLCIDPVSLHLVEAQNGTSLKKSTENSLLSHKV